MKIAVITNHLAHYRYQLYECLDDTEGIDVTHFSGRSNNRGIETLSPRGLKKVVYLDNLLGPSGFLWQRGLLKNVLQNDFDAYIFTGDTKYLSTWLAAIILRFRNKSIYFWTIGWHRPERGFKKWIRHTFYRLANKLLLYGPAERHLAIAHGYPAERTEVIYNSVVEPDEQKVEAIARTEKKHIVGAISRLNPVKRFDLLIEAVSLLNKSGSSVKIILGGDGPERAALEELASRLDVSIEFLGAIHNEEDIESFYRRVRVTVMPSVSGLTTIQSLAYGVPVITDDNEEQAPEAQAIIEGLTGARYKAGSATDLAAVLHQWITKQGDQSLTVARQCIDEVNKRWSPAVQADRMLKAISKSR